MDIKMKINKLQTIQYVFRLLKSNINKTLLSNVCFTIVKSKLHYMQL